MYKFSSNIFAIIITNVILIGILLFQMLKIQVPITQSFELKAKKDGEMYYIEIADDSSFINSKTDIMYISTNKDEKVINVRIEIQDQHIYFENSDPVFSENYDQIYTYEIVTKRISLIECIFLRGGKTIE